MSEMVERVARALCKAFEVDPDELRIIDATPEPAWRLYAQDAQVAIAAMRAPTKAMLDAGYAESPESFSLYDVFGAMIDEALK